jgi:hypothetical protein
VSQPPMSTNAPPPGRPMTWNVRAKRLGLVAAMTLTSLNVWTGSPLLGLWVGSRVQGSGPPQMGAIAVVALVIAIVSGGLLKILNRINDGYDKLLHRKRRKRRKRQSPWLRSLRGEREDFHDPDRDQLSAVEIVAIAMVLIVAVAFEVWFFFFSSSPIDQRSGRD